MVSSAADLDIKRTSLFKQLIESITHAINEHIKKARNTLCWMS